MKVVAAQTAPPKFEGDQTVVGNIKRIVAQTCFFVTFDTESDPIQVDPSAPVFQMAAQTGLGLQGVSDFGEPRFQEAVDRVTVVGPLMTGQAGLAFHLTVAIIGRTLAPSEQKAQIGLKLLSGGAWRGTVAVRAC